MAPKKSAQSSMVGVYDVEIMNDVELKMYIEALKEESERMKAAFGTHQQEKREMAVLLMNTQEDILKRYEVLIQKELEMQQLLSESNDKLKTEDEINLITELETNEATEKGELATFTEVNTADVLHKNAERKLKEDLKHREREVEKCHLAQTLLSADFREKKEEQHAHLMEFTESNLSSISEEYIQKYRDAMQNFYSGKVNTMSFIWDEIMDKNICEDSLAEHAEKMSLYFRELFWKNTNASATLKSRVEKLEKELNKLTIQLRNVEKENKILLESVGPQTVSQNREILSHCKRIDTKDVELEEIVYENDVLNEKLRQITAERDTLRNRFISAMRRICQKADFGYFLAEELLCHLQNPQIKYSALNSESVTSSTQNNDLKRTESAVYEQENR